MLDLCPLCEAGGVSLKIGHHRSNDLIDSLSFPQAPASSSAIASSKSKSSVVANTTSESESPMFVSDSIMDRVYISEDILSILEEATKITTKGKVKVKGKSVKLQKRNDHSRVNLMNPGEESEGSTKCTSILDGEMETTQQGRETICSHGKAKYFCKECKGKYLCEHGIRKYDCASCRGPSICPHGRRKARCVDCGGTSMCVHGRRKW